MAILDFDLDSLTRASDLVDARLDWLDRDASASPDPDGFGIFDQMENLAGFGFVACQAYLTAKIAESDLGKTKALDRGPSHICGCPIAALVNAAANLWKHSPEWCPDAPSGRAKKTLETLSSLGIDPHASYPAGNALDAILTPQLPRFSNLIPFLTQWRDLLRA